MTMSHVLIFRPLHSFAVMVNTLRKQRSGDDAKGVTNETHGWQRRHYYDWWCWWCILICHQVHCHCTDSRKLCNGVHS